MDQTAACEAWAVIQTGWADLRVQCVLGADHAADHEARIRVVPVDSSSGSTVYLWWDSGQPEVRAAGA